MRRRRDHPDDEARDDSRSRSRTSGCHAATRPRACSRASRRRAWARGSSSSASRRGGTTRASRTSEVLAFRRLCRAARARACGDRRLRRLRFAAPTAAMTDDGGVEFLDAQIEVARALGFPVVRLHAGIPSRRSNALAPSPSARTSLLATEFQGPQSPDSPGLHGRPRCYASGSSGPPAIALVLDFSVAMRALPASFAAAVCSAGMARRRSRPDRRAVAARRAARRAVRRDRNDGSRRRCGTKRRSGFVRFGRQDPARWAPLVPQVAHAHAKFWELDGTGDDPTMRTAEAFDPAARRRLRGRRHERVGRKRLGRPRRRDGFAMVRTPPTTLLARLSQRTPASAPARCRVEHDRPQRTQGGMAR